MIELVRNPYKFMNAIALMLLRPLIQAAVTAFGQVVLDFFASWRAAVDQKALGRAEAISEAKEAALQAEREMGAVDMAEFREVLRRLKEGDA